MKKCPFCKAEIEENARFCLYCMTSLEEKQEIETPKEKNKRWLYLIAAVFVFLLIGICIFFALKKYSPANTSGKMSSKSQASLETNLDKPSDNKKSTPDSSAKPENKLPDDNLETDSQVQSTTTESEKSTDSNTQEDPTSGSTNKDSNSNTTSNKQENNNSNSSDSVSEPSVTTATYLYRDAKYGDDFSVSANLENAVVITGVSTVSSNGEYIIPETLGGKRVVAIMGLAFCDDNIKDTVKKVVVPASVKTIWSNAFANCHNLTDIYFRGKAIYVETNAFAAKSNRTGTLTIHCSYGCSDRNYRYYRNSASNYGALYEEWDG